MSNLIASYLLIRRNVTSSIKIFSADEFVWSLTWVLHTTCIFQCTSKDAFRLMLSPVYAL